MGNESSSLGGESRRSSSASRSRSHSDHGQSSYSHNPVDSYGFTPYVGTPIRQQTNLEHKYSRIDDNYSSLQEVTEALRHAGLESSNLIIGIDFTKSNEWTGRRSYGNRSLHHIGNGLNPYQVAISIIGKTLAAFDDDNLIPCYGFGDASTHDQDVFSLSPNGEFCVGFEEVLRRYREILPHLKLSGPTSFAPIIEMAVSIVEQSGGQYHVLLIIADGQVTGNAPNTGQLCIQERKTIEAIVEASNYPLSIVLVGVGDGPWDMMRDFDDNIRGRKYDNFQFVNFMEIISKRKSQSRMEAEFALAALMEIPFQYKATMDLGLLGRRRGSCPQRAALPPPAHASSSFNSHSTPPSFGNRTPFHPQATSASSYQPAQTYGRQICSICMYNTKDMAFGCGHQTCCECGENLQVCPVCWRLIENKIRLY